MTKDKSPTLSQEKTAPSSWVTRFLPRNGTGKRALDLACGSGRHTALLLKLGYQVTAVDRDLSKLGGLAAHPSLTPLETDLEQGGPFPLADQTFDLLMVTNYLHRPLFPDLVAAVAPGGVFLYETFARGNEQFGRPSNPDFLLKPGELLTAVTGQLEVIAYENLEIREPKPARVQRITAFRPPA
ncbi:class I SAM-dependent methyltransferase [Rhodovibrionaceae bacterium A322]